MNEKRRRANAFMMKYYSGMIDDGSWKTAAGDIAVFNTKYRKNLKSLVVQLEPIQSGSGDPSPDNIRPISGRTGATVWRTGKNLLNNADAEIGTAWNGATNSARARLVIPCRPSTTYTLSMDRINNIETIYKNYAPQVPASTAGPRITTFPDTFTTEEDSAFVIISFSKTGITQADVDALRLQLELGSTATSYEPYTGTTIPVSWETEAGTVYGAELDVVSGKLTVDRAMNVYDGSEDENWSYYNISTGNLFRTIIADRTAETITGVSNQAKYLCNSYTVATNESTGRTTGHFSGANKNADFVNDNFTTVESWKTNLANHPLQFIFPLAEPVTYQLTPQQIQTLIGENVIWSDAGPVSIEYWS